ncbi:hypothetical protein ACTWKA_21560 [Bacillus sp. 3A_MP1]
MIVTAWVLLIMFGLFALSDLNLTEDETKYIKFFIIMKFVSVFIAAVAAGVIWEDCFNEKCKNNWITY